MKVKKKWIGSYRNSDNSQKEQHRNELKQRKNLRIIADAATVGVRKIADELLNGDAFYFWEDVGQVRVIIAEFLADIIWVIDYG